ncbi:hypothetical protein SAMN02745830_00142 [Streptomyces sp. Amel2xC10]|nr:hypothetical protein SAMN02745830_00142 [Streptomyces sp. Amel2xC10]
MHPTLRADLDRLPELLASARDFATHALAGIGERPVSAAVPAPAPGPLPTAGVGAQARRLGEGVAAVPGLRLLAPVRLNVVCFTLTDGPTPERLGALARAVADSGEAFLTPTVLRGTPALRAAFSNWRTTEADTDRVRDALACAVRELGPVPVGDA